MMTREKIDSRKEEEEEAMKSSTHLALMRIRDGENAVAVGDVDCIVRVQKVL